MPFSASLIAGGTLSADYISSAMGGGPGGVPFAFLAAISPPPCLSRVAGSVQVEEWRRALGGSTGIGGQGQQLGADGGRVFGGELLGQGANAGLGEGARGDGGAGVGQQGDGVLAGYVRQGGDCGAGRGLASVRVVAGHRRAGVADDGLHDGERGVGFAAETDKGVTQGVETDLHNGALAGVDRFTLCVLELG